MWDHFRKTGIVSLILLTALVLSSCDASSSGTADGETAEGTGAMTESDAKTEDTVNSAVDIDHELDQYEPKKDQYNFYFTYKTVHPWWDAVALGMEEAQRQYHRRILQTSPLFLSGH